MQEEGQEQPNDMEGLAENANEEVVNETPQDEQEDLEEVAEDLEDVKNEQFNYYEENSKVEDNDEPVTFYNTMYHEKESSQDENIIQCAMMHEDELPELKDWAYHSPFNKNGNGHANMVQCTKSTVRSIIAVYNM